MNDESLRRGRILMVDDEIGGLCLLENVLNRLGFPHVRKHTCPYTFLAECETWQPDLVIVDLEMPKLSGIKITEHIRAAQAAQSTEACLPILMITGSPEASAKRDALRAGVTDIMLKPFDLSELLMRIRNLLRTRFQHLEIQSQNQALEDKVAERTASLRKAVAELETSQRQVVQQERLRAFGEMAGGVVHDFNNSLMSIIGYSELILQDGTMLDDPEALHHYVKTINTAGRDAAHVVSRLRDFYRPREQTDVFTPVEINDVLEAVGPMTKPKWHDHALESGRTIRLELELQKTPPLLGNAAELREVFTNLIFNAVDAMPTGGTITLRSREHDGCAEIEFADTGTGMTEEVRQRCLEPFFSTKAEQGTGLGLATVFGIIRRHGGVLTIESELGCGTTIRMTFPTCVSEAAKVAEAQPALDRSLRVLVVDDEPAARDVVTRYLVGDGHRVTTATSGSEAMREAQAGKFDLVITDHGMPGMNGLQLADALHDVDAKRPIILLTGFAFGAEQQPASIRRVLKKPLVPAALRGSLHEVFGLAS
jgi:signal transduction histidine kinase